MREACGGSLVIMQADDEYGANVKAFDPAAMKETQSLLPNEEKLKLMGTKLKLCSFTSRRY